MKIVAKHFPLRNHKFANLAATVTLAAEKEGKFWSLRKKLMENYSSLNKEKIYELANSEGISNATLDAAVMDKKIAALIRKDMNDGRKAGVGGTPSLFVNGKQVKNRSIEGFSRMIDDELKRLNAK